MNPKQFLSAIFLSIFCAFTGCTSDEDNNSPANTGATHTAITSVGISLYDGAGTEVTRAADELVGLLNGVGGATVTIGAADGVEALLVVEAPGGDLAKGDFKLVGTEAGTIVTHTLTAGSAIGLAYGIYAYAEQLGVRFLHPERTVVPNYVWKPEAGDQSESSPYRRRGFHIHTMHPLPMMEFLLVPSEEGLQYAKNWVDWLLHNRQNLFNWYLLDTVPDYDAWTAHAAKIADYAHERGVEIGIEFGFTFSQQNAYNFFEERLADDDRENIRLHLARLMQAPFDYLILQAGGSEFFTTDEQQELDRMNILVDELATNYPDTTVTTWIHPKSDLMSELYPGEYYFHLARHADPRMGILVHTVMFYTLFDPAPVYNSEDFGFQLDLLIEEAEKGEHPVQYMPETSYWCTMDIDVPNFLPLYVHNRATDLHELAAYNLDAHLNFTSGHEWGYWLNDYAVARIGASIAREWQEPIRHAAAIYDAAADDIAEVVIEMTEYQYDELHLKNLIAYFSGEDYADDAGVIADIYTHPLRKRFYEFGEDEETDLQDFESDIMARLETAETNYGGWLQRVQDAESRIPQPAQEYYLELIDCIEIGLLRVQHSLELYRATIAARRAELAGEDPDAAALPHLENARVLTATAIGKGLDYSESEATYEFGEEDGIVTRREAYYRYPVKYSAEWTGNLTMYPFRYLGMTRTGYTWVRQDIEAATRTGNPGLMTY
jgi:hypothetical protein